MQDLHEAGPVPFHLGALLRNVRAGVRLALFLPVRALDYRASPLDFALLFGFDLAFWIALAAARAGFAGELDPSAIVVYLATGPLVLLAALVVSLIYRAPQRLALVAVALIASDPFFELTSLALPWIAAWSGLGELVYVLYLAWIWVVAVRAIAVCAGRQRPELYQGAFVASAMIALAFFAFPKAEVWHASAEEEPAAVLSDERVFHRQGELIEQALAGLARGRPGVPELYFVGFAPDASEEVFLRELRFVRRLFDERLGTAGRSIALASSHTALEELPIASATNLGRALARVGEAMNPEEDVLFLFVSAHGDAEHRLSASQPPLELTALTPTSLARMLQASAVKWKVVVVSACYGGGFIEPLRDENTVVITAAAADRSSFGCEPGRDFTYFGEAYFREALARTPSFVGAFEAAREIVAKKEADEGLTPSLPQIHVGTAIAERLRRLALR